MSDAKQNLLQQAARVNPKHANDPAAAEAIRKLQEVARYDPERLAHAERTDLVKFLTLRHQLANAVLKHAIVEDRRVDLLCTQVLGYEVRPFHQAIIQWQFRYNDNLQLVFRGAGKSTVGTVGKAIWYICVDRSLRLLIASKKHANATRLLRDVSAHLTTNQKLLELFGEFRDPNPRSALKWNESEITVVGRKRIYRESTITCVGVDGSLAGGHFDVEFSDDIVDNTNSTTQEMRDKIEAWYYSVMDPCMEPADDVVPYRGDRNRVGTRYHYDDLYGRWMAKNEEEVKMGRAKPIAVQVIPALDEFDRSPWPEKWKPEEFMARRRRYGKIIFDAQYQCTTESMKGAIIQFDDCQQIAQSEVMQMFEDGKLDIYMGVDLAISEKKTADKFAIVVLGRDRAKRYYVLYFYQGRLRFSEQTKRIVDTWRRFKVERIAIESNGYQLAQLQELKRQHPDIPLRKIQQKAGDDKVSRAQRLSPIFESHLVYFPPGNDLLIDQIVRMPNVAHDDAFDAFDLAVAASKSRDRKERDEPGLI